MIANESTICLVLSGGQFLITVTRGGSQAKLDPLKRAAIER